jgi:hypothetical protein
MRAFFQNIPKNVKAAGLWVYLSKYSARKLVTPGGVQ